MIEFFSYDDLDHQHILRIEGADPSETSPRGCLTTYNPNNYEGIISRLVANQSVKACSDLLLDKSKPIDQQLISMTKFLNLDPTKGGFRSITGVDLIHAGVNRAYRAHQTRQWDYEDLIQQADYISNTHPLAARFKSTGLNVHNCVLFMSFIFDPYRFIGTHGGFDMRLLNDFVSANVGVDSSRLKQFFEDETFSFTKPEEILWTSMLLCWCPADGNIEDAENSYWQRRYLSIVDDVMAYNAEDARHRAIVAVTAEVGDYITSKWRALLDTPIFIAMNTEE